MWAMDGDIMMWGGCNTPPTNQIKDGRKRQINPISNSRRQLVGFRPIHKSKTRYGICAE
ncbi:hypothetical protein BRADI_3g34231v3 [Brachypodium distachyon]|uniref:Uncharacterized protein n=1 Tax=Brachypodium distachyon TaxID=15368 RepID=A0A2K2D107_BRADI|nr:hypothetical protein BRADI_3g34231v3 [Brachypodium distachyon]